MNIYIYIYIYKYIFESIILKGIIFSESPSYLIKYLKPFSLKGIL